MSCVVQFEDLKFNFIENKYKQKLLLGALIGSDLININQILLVLETSLECLMSVYHGVSFFADEIAEKLGKLFLMVFGYADSPHK